MMYPKVLYQMKQCAGDSFEPANGTEGMMFTESFCEQCTHEKFCHTQRDGDKQCDIWDRALIFWHDSSDEGKKNYPKEWRFDQEGWPHCTAWKKWDWGFGDDDDFNEPPPEPEPIDPNQLQIFPMWPTEKDFESVEIEEKIAKL